MAGEGMEDVPHPQVRPPGQDQAPRPAVIELVGRESGYIRSNPPAAQKLLRTAFTQARLSIAEPSNEQETTTYNNILALLSYAGTTEVTKDAIRQRVGNAMAVQPYDKFRSQAVIDLGSQGDAEISLRIEAEGPTDPYATPQLAGVKNFQGMRLFGEPNLKISLEAAYSDGTNEVRSFEFNPDGETDFQHWRRDRQPMQYDRTDERLGLKMLTSLTLPTVNEQGELNYGTERVDDAVLSNFLLRVGMQRRSEDLGGLLEVQLQKGNPYDGYLYLPPFFYDSHNTNGRFVSRRLPVSSFPEDAITNQSYLHRIDQLASEQGIDISGTRNYMMQIMFHTPGTFDHVIALGQINGVSAPIDTQIRTNIADRLAPVLLRELPTMQRIRELYEQAQQAQASNEMPIEIGTDIGVILNPLLHGQDDLAEFQDYFFGLTHERKPELEILSKQIFNAVSTLNKIFMKESIYTDEEKSKLRIKTKDETIIDAEVKPESPKQLG